MSVLGWPNGVKCYMTWPRSVARARQQAARQKADLWPAQAGEGGLEALGLIQSKTQRKRI